MEVEVDVPERLSLQHLRAGGPQPNEVLQPEDEPGRPAGERERGRESGVRDWVGGWSVGGWERRGGGIG